MPNQPTTHVSNFRIPADVKDRAMAKARAEGRTLTDIVVTALDQYAPPEDEA